MITDLNDHKTSAIVRAYAPVKKSIRGLYTHNHFMLTGATYRNSLSAAMERAFTKEQRDRLNIAQFYPLLDATGTAFVELLDALRVYDCFSELEFSVIPKEFSKVRNPKTDTSIIGATYGRKGCINGQPIHINLVALEDAETEVFEGAVEPIAVEYVAEVWDKSCPHVLLVENMLSVFRNQSVSHGHGYGIDVRETMTVLEYAFVLDNNRYVVQVILDNHYYRITQ